jgi:hypothetical protein
MSGLQGSISTAVHEGTTGNLSFGNVGIGQRQAHSGVSITSDSGQVLHRHNDGSSTLDNSGVESRLGFDVRGSERMESALSSQVSNEQSLAQTKSIQAAQNQTHGFEMMINDHRSIESSKGYEQNFSSEAKESFNRVNNAVNDFAKEHGISRDQSAELFSGIGGNLGIGNGNIGINVDGGAKYSRGSHESDLYKEALNYSKSHQLSKDFAVVQSAVESSRLNLTNSKGESINESFSQATNLNKEAGQHFEAAKRYSEQQQHIKSNAAEIDRNYNQELWGELVAKYGTYGATNITNPSNRDESVLNKEIDHFIADKASSIQNVNHPNLASEFNRGSASFTSNHHGSEQNPYRFSGNMQQIDNSQVQGSVAKQINSNQQVINDAKVNNSNFGQEIAKKIKQEEDDGLL